MEPERGDAAELLVWGVTGADSNSDAGAACLCPAAVAAGPAGSAFPRHALEQEVLRRGALQLQGGVGGGDRRRERKMKNRESAARSRARRCAYVKELEKEVSALRAEIEGLRKTCEELKKEAAEAAAPAKKKAHPQRLLQLQRSSSATF